jgi:hypothetical protein
MLDAVEKASPSGRREISRDAGGLIWGLIYRNYG